MANRHVCSVLEEMRNCIKTSNFSYLSGLIEEAQTMVNRMEAGLWDQRDFTKLTDKISKLKKEVKELEAKKKFLDPEAKPSNPSNPFHVED